MSDFDISPEDLEILIQECNETISQFKKQEWQHMMEIKAIKKQLKEVRRDRDYLVAVQKGSEWTDLLDSCDGDTLEDKKRKIIGTLTLKYNTLFARAKALATMEPN